MTEEKKIDRKERSRAIMRVVWATVYIALYVHFMVVTGPNVEPQGFTEWFDLLTSTGQLLPRFVVFVLVVYHVLTLGLLLEGLFPSLSYERLNQVLRIVTFVTLFTLTHLIALAILRLFVLWSTL